MVDSISTIGIQLSSKKTLSAGQVQLATLSEQLTTGKLSLNLTDYASSDAQKLLNFNSEKSQQAGFLNVISAIQPRMEVYESSLVGLEDTASTAFSSLVAANTYNPNTNSTTQNLIKGYLDQVEYYLNQKVGDRYIYAGSRFSPTTATHALTDGLTFTAASAGASGNNIDVSVAAGSAADLYTITITNGPTTETYTDITNLPANALWTNLDAAIAALPSALVGAVPNGTGNLDPATLGVLPVTYNLTGGANIAPVTDLTALPSPPTELPPYLATGNTVPSYDAAYDPTFPLANVPEANVKETVSIDTTKKLTYGITSNEDGFQQLIMGLRFAYAATNDQANYETHMNTARDLISKGLGNIRATHTDSSNAYSTMKQTETNIKSNISNLTKQVDNIQAVDINEVAVKIVTLQAQLQASYSAVSNMINLSILDYM